MEEKRSYDDLSFRILNTNSESPTIMIISKDVEQPYIMKIWYEEDKSEEAGALDYEEAVYKYKISKILRKHPNTSLLGYLGGDSMPVRELIVSNLDINNVNRMTILVKAFGLFLGLVKYKSKRHFGNYSLKILDDLRVDGPTFSRILKKKVKFFKLPLVKFTTLEKTMKIGTASTDDMVLITRRLVRTLYNCYKEKLIHNDLHAGNVMVKNRTDVLIYDWDRGYIDGHNNPQLDTTRCGRGGSLCIYSQCNIFRKGGYDIDIFKILYYILDTRKDHDGDIILERVFGISNRENNLNILKDIYYKLTQNSFFMKGENGDVLNPVDAQRYKLNVCSFLQYPDDEMEKVANYFGPIEVMNVRCGGKNKPLKKEDITNDYLTDLFVGIMGGIAIILGAGVYNRFFAFGDNKRGRELHDEYRSREFKEPDESHQNTKRRKRVSVRESTYRNLAEEKEYSRLKNLDVETLTVQDLIDAIDLRNNVVHGRRVETRQVPIPGGPSPPLQPIWEIMQENDLRKFGPINRN